MGAYGGLRSARWLKTFRQAPMVTAFRNLESGQVLFSQTLAPQEFYIDQQFKWPNWQNKKPTTRKDLWRPLAVAEVPTYESAVQLYRNLVELRHRRDMYERKQARDWRRKSTDGNIWFWNQYRPTYTYEAVADLASALEAMGLNDRAVLHWDALYHKGDDGHWQDVNVEHRSLPAHNPREQAIVLNKVREAALDRLAAPESVVAEPVDERFREAVARSRAIRQRNHEQRLELKQAVLAKRPDLVELAERGVAVRQATRAWRAAVKAFDPYTPRGQRGAAKQPIKLRQRALRQAKRAFRDLKRRISAKSKKRRVAQPRVRMQ